MDEELARHVGQRIRRLRTLQGFSLRRQAELAEVSASALSALENGRGGMSLSALQRVARHFGLTITELLAEDGADATNGSPKAESTAPELFRNCTATGTAVQRGSGTMYQLLGSGRGHRLQPYVLAFVPGGGFASDRIGHLGEEFAFVVIGSVDLLLGDEEIRLHQGDAVRFRTETPHSFRNASESGIALVLGAATPPW